MKTPRILLETSIALALLGALLLSRSAEATPPLPNPLVIRIPDLNFVHRTYYLVPDAPADIDLSSILVYLDDQVISVGTDVRGAVRPNPDAPADSATNPELFGMFRLLTNGTDYTIFYPWVVAAHSSLRLPVIHLEVPLSTNEVLGVSYIDNTNGTPIRVGAILGDTLLIKAIGVPLNLIPIDPFTGLLDRRSPWFPSLQHELRNFYDLGIRDVPEDRFRLRIRKLSLTSDIDPDGVEGVPYLQTLGLDQLSPADSANPRHPDGFVDPQFLDPTTGTLFLPDLHPFDPDTAFTGACGPGYSGLACLDNYGRNILREDAPFPTDANPNVYYRRYADPLVDERFYLEATILAPPPPGGTLRQNAPNPFNPGTSIRFDLNRDGEAIIRIYDVQGRLIAKLLDATLPAGAHEIRWDGKGADAAPLASGVYWCVLETGGERYSRTIVLVR